MSTQTLPTPPAPWPSKWRDLFILEGQQYWFVCQWNDRDGFWYLTVGASDLTTQAQGVTLNLGTDKLEYFKYGSVPPGFLDVIDTSGKYIEPTRQDMGSRVVIQYTDSTDQDPNDRELFPMTSSPPS